jgi:hypothetical protein
MMNKKVKLVMNQRTLMKMMIVVVIQTKKLRLPLKVKNLDHHQSRAWLRIIKIQLAKKILKIPKILRLNQYIQKRMRHKKLIKRKLRRNKLKPKMSQKRIKLKMVKRLNPTKTKTNP